jgi:hypothetical protein
MVDTLAGDRRHRLKSSHEGFDGGTEDESAAYDCSAHPRVLTIVAFRSVGADCREKERKAISKEENRP